MTYLEIILALSAVAIIAILSVFLRYRHLSREIDAKWEKIHARAREQFEEDVDWEAEYHKLHARYAHGQVCIGKLVRENKALKSQAPTPKRRGRAPKKDASTDE